MGASKNLKVRFRLMPFGSENRRKSAKDVSIPLISGNFPPPKSDWDFEEGLYVVRCCGGDI
ncbi:MAG TPA: hypothetical protein DCO86_01505 [Spirochaetaceae bacterium]|nr:hypothetical protein [Spirochaetaceae bacterium]